MNKQEAIDQLKESLSKMIEKIEDENDFNKGYRYATQHCFDIISQIDEPQKPVVPQFVADWYEEHKDDFDKNLFEFIYYVVSCYTIDGKVDFEELTHLYKDWMSNDFKRWMSMAYENGAITTLVNMHQFGYEVEKEKLYTVEIPNPNLNAHAILQKTDNGIVLIVVTNARWRCCENSKLTESEIKQDFEWAWQFAKEVKK